jgi:hypothetical protein
MTAFVLPEILRRRYFFILIFLDGWLDERNDRSDVLRLKIRVDQFGRQKQSLQWSFKKPTADAIPRSLHRNVALLSRVPGRVSNLREQLFNYRFLVILSMI